MVAVSRRGLGDHRPVAALSGAEIESPVGEADAKSGLAVGVESAKGWNRHSRAERKNERSTLSSLSSSFFPEFNIFLARFTPLLTRKRVESYNSLFAGLAALHSLRRGLGLERQKLVYWQRVKAKSPANGWGKAS